MVTKLKSDFSKYFKTDSQGKFYTPLETARWCLDQLKEFLPEEPTYLEPSAGLGVFVDLLKMEGKTVIAYDIDPKVEGIIKADFLEVEMEYRPNRVTIGNPPYGHRGYYALAFINRCSQLGDTVAFIVPPILSKWGLQRHVNVDLRLAFQKELPSLLFFTENGEMRHHRRMFQIWKRGPGVDLRLQEAPASKHEDFKLNQYICIPGSDKVFKEPFDFAVPRQGWHDYSRRETEGDKCERNIQWMLIKAKDKETEEILRRIDYKKLSLKNSSSPGYGKADVVEEYQRIKNGTRKDN